MYKNKAIADDLFIVIIMYFDITIPLDNLVTKEWHRWTTKLIITNQIIGKHSGTNNELQFVEWSLTLNQ